MQVVQFILSINVFVCKQIMDQGHVHKQFMGMDGKCVIVCSALLLGARNNILKNIKLLLNTH